MPGAVRTPEDEKSWSRAKDIFKENKGHVPGDGDWPLVMHIFKNVRDSKTASLRNLLIRLAHQNPAIREDVLSLVDQEDFNRASKTLDRQLTGLGFRPSGKTWKWQDGDASIMVLLDQGETFLIRLIVRTHHGVVENLVLKPRDARLLVKAVADVFKSAETWTQTLSAN